MKHSVLKGWWFSLVSTRTLFRLGCVATAVFLILLAVVLHSSLQVQRYRRELENNYTRSIQEMSGLMNAISADLKKASYSGTPAQVSAVSARIWKNAGAAKTSLGNLPAGDADTEALYRFLSQVGDYSMYLSRKAVQGEEITPEERENYELMLEYAQELNSRIADFEYLFSSGQVDLDSLMSGEDSFTGAEGEEAVPVSMDLTGLEQQPEGYPALIYDGPFSDNLLQRESLMLRDQEEVHPDEALLTAAAYAGLRPEELVRGSDEESHMPSYSFSSDSVELGVSRQGGYVTWLVSGREIGARQLTVEQARDTARAWLEARRIGAMQETYYELSNGVLTINYAYTQEDTICYTDLIKVGVAMDDGAIVFYDARGYLNNHHERDLPEAALSPYEALDSLSPALNPESVRLALIPSAGGEELLTWEFKCTGRDQEHVLVYINTETGAEEQLFILIENEYGTLAI